MNAWSISQGVLKLFPWTKDFNPSTLKQTSAQVWIKIYGLSQEYWRPRIIFAIANSIGTPIYIDSGTNKSDFDRPFGHFVRVLVDLDLTKEFSYKILVKRVRFAFFVDIDYEKVPKFYSYCSCIGHSLQSCRRNVSNNKAKTVENPHDKGDLDKDKDKDMDKDMDKDRTNATQNTQLVKEEVGRRHVMENLDKEESNNNDGEDIIQLVIKETSKDIVDFLQGQASNEEGHSESKYIDATQMVDLVPETQIDEAHKKQITDFLLDSWANMAEENKDDDQRVDLFQEKDFQLMTSKRRRNKKSLALGNTGLVSS